MADQVEEVKQKTDIVSLISESVELKKAGRNFKGLCPFHSEKTPSFMVSPELQIYKCFGCGEAGDAFTFLQNREGMDFPEALKYLADKAGVKLEPTNFKSRGEKEVLYEVNSLTARFYQYILLKHPSGKKALSYLTKERGLKPETIRIFQLGFSPDSPNVLKKFLVEKKKIKPSVIEKAGIGYPKGSDLVDRFRGRVIFPLHDHRGNPVGFAGRTLPDEKRDTAKYINSPETPIYSKGRLLYGLDVTRSEVKKAGKAIVVEGEFDLISSWQAGIKNIVATKGTALTEDQVRLVSRFASSLVLALDADLAGNEAARRGISIAQNEGLEVSVVKLKGFKDPDEAARKDPEGYRKAIETAVDVWEFMIDSIIAKYGVGSAAGKAKISRELTPILATISDKIVQAHYVKVLARKLDVSEGAVSQEISRVKVSDKQALEIELPKVSDKTRRERLEERLLTLIFHSEPTRLAQKEIQEAVTTTLPKKIVEEYKKYKRKEFDPKSFANSLPAELVGGFTDMVMADVELISKNTKDFEKELELIQKELRIISTKEKLISLQQKMEVYEEKGEKEKLKKAEEEFSKLSGKLSAFEDEEMEGIILTDRE